MDNLGIKAVASVKIIKYDEDNNAIGTTEHEVELTEKEVEALWQLQQKV